MQGPRYISPAIRGSGADVFGKQKKKSIKQFTPRELIFSVSSLFYRFSFRCNWAVSTIKCALQSSKTSQMLSTLVMWGRVARCFVLGVGFQSSSCKAPRNEKSSSTLVLQGGIWYVYCFASWESFQTITASVRTLFWSRSGVLSESPRDCLM